MDERSLARTAAQQHFVHRLTNNTDFETSANDYLQTMAMVYATYQSSEQNQVIQLNDVI